MSPKVLVLVLCLALGSSLLLVAQNEGFRPTTGFIIGLGACGVAVVAATVVIKKRGFITYRVSQHNKPIGTTAGFKEILGVDEITPKGSVMLARNGDRIVAHAYFKISSVPYTLDDLDQQKRHWMTGNFVRILSTLNFGFELIPRVFPVPAAVYLKDIQKKIDDLRLTLSAEGSLANPGRQARLKQLEKLATRLLEGEGVRDVSFLVHIFVEGKNENSTLAQLEINAKTLTSALESGLNVRATRLVNDAMVRSLKEFFPASMNLVPSRLVRMFCWDIAYLVPLARPKLPPVEKLLNGVYMGRTVDGTIACLDISRYPNPHLLVMGKSGYGKSTTVKTFISRQYDLFETSILIIDYAGEYASWVKSRNGSVFDMRENTINPFELGEATLTDRMRQLVDAFQKICDFKSINQRNSFTYYVMKAYYNKGFRPNNPETWKNKAPTLADVIKLMDEEVGGLQMMRQITVMTLLDRLRVLSSGPFGVFGESTLSVDQVTRGFTCIDLSRVTSNTMKDMVAWTMLQHIDSKMRLRGVQHGVRLIVVLDEAWKLCRDEESLAVTIVKEGRKYGYSLCVSSQDATADFAESILANAGTVVIHHTEHPKYLAFFERSYGLNEQEVTRVQNLPVGEAMMKIGDDPRPFFVRIDMEQVEQQRQLEVPRSEAVEEYAKPIEAKVPVIQNIEKSDSYANWSQILPPQQKLGSTRANSPSAKLLPRNAARLLRVVEENPGLKTSDYYRMLNLNDFQGNKAKRELENDGMLESVELPRLEGAGRWGRTLRLKKQTTNRFGGPLHQHLVSTIAMKLRKEKHDVEVEYPLSDGRAIDLLVDGSIAIEVERRDFSLQNITKNIDAGVEKIFVVCQSDTQREKFLAKLRESGIAKERITITTISKLLASDFRSMVESDG
jgi:predicted transcriptional regulator